MASKRRTRTEALNHNHRRSKLKVLYHDHRRPKPPSLNPTPSMHNPKLRILRPWALHPATINTTPHILNPSIATPPQGDLPEKGSAPNVRSVAFGFRNWLHVSEHILSNNLYCCRYVATQTRIIIQTHVHACVLEYIYIDIHTRTQTYIPTYVHMYVRTYIQAYRHSFIHSVHTSIHPSIHSFHTHTYIYVCIHNMCFYSLHIYTYFCLTMYVGLSHAHKFEFPEVGASC